MRFKQISKITELLREEIDRLSCSELTKLIAECNSLNQTNCGWQMYGLKEIVIGMAKAQRRWKKQMKK